VIDVVRQRLEEPSARGLALAISRAVRDGALSPGQRLDPIRAVATGLGLSPTTVSAAWSLLNRSGTIRTDGRRGTRITEQSTPGPVRYRRALEHPADLHTDLSTGVPDPALLPDLGPVLRRLPGAMTPGSYLDAPVLPGLLAVLHEAWPALAETIAVVDGAMDALDQLVASVLRYGDRVAVENPCFPPLLDLLEVAGAHVVGVDVDEAGPVPGSLRRAVDAGARMFFCQPRAQNPTGASMTSARVTALADVLRGRDVVVVENDSAGAVAAAELVTLAGALPGQVVHVRGFSKSHGPDLRLAAVGGPAWLVDPIVERRYLGQAWTSRLLQQVLLDLLTDPAGIAAVQHARNEYARRRRLVVAELRRLGIDLPDGDGLNLWLPVADESAALVRLASRGIGAGAGSPFAVGAGLPPHLRVTVGLVADGHESLAAELAAAAGAGSWGGPR
jgi:DNA-binding transcriptional MocR family regulator